MLMPDAMGFPSLRESQLFHMAFVSILLPATLVSRVQYNCGGDPLSSFFVAGSLGPTNLN